MRKTTITRAVCLLFYPVLGTLSITLRGSSEYAVPGQPYTLICSVPDKTVLVRFLRPAVSPSTTPTIVGIVQVSGNGDCYNVIVSPAAVCLSTVCSCVSDGAGNGSEFRWILTSDNIRDQSVWFCEDFSNNPSPKHTLQFAVSVTSVALQNPPAVGSDLTVIEGTSTSLVCVTSACRPAASVLWYIGGTNYTSASNQTVSDKSGNVHITTSTLTFIPDRNINGEKIICSAYNYGNNTVTADNPPELNVLYPSDNKATLNVSSVSIEEGQQVYIMCEIKKGNPKAQITWNCFGGTTTDVSTGTDSRSVITVVGSSSQDGQPCICRGQHNLVIIIPAQVTFNIEFAPKNTSLSPSGQQTVTEGQDLQPVTCSAICNPVCSYNWSRQGDSTTIEGAVLRLDGIIRDQDGVYRCTASNKYGHKSTDVTVVVNYKPGNSVTLNPSDNTYVRNENDILPDITCEADCKPSCSYVWILPSNNNKTGPVLSLSMLKQDEQGQYMCVARNNIGESVKTVSVTVQYGPGESVALNPSDVAYVKNENDILPDLSCVADCRPNCTYRWMLPNNTNTSGPVLSLSVLKRDEQGTYRCVARNIVGESLKTVTITVQYGPGNSITFNSTSSVTQMENTTLAPVECSAECRPSCTITWTYKDGRTLTNPLSLGELKRDEAGDYTCNASNIVHSRSKKFTLLVQYPPRITSLKHVTTGPNISEHSSVTLRCEVESYPPPTISWFNMSGKGTSLQTNNSVLVSSFILQSASCFDTGQYNCSATNGLGSDATSAIAIYVLCSPRLYKFSSEKNVLGIGNGENLYTSVQFLANPPPLFTWEFSRNSSENFTKLNNNSNDFVYYNYHQRVVHTSTAIRSKMEEQDFGYYRIFADNGVGSNASSTIKVVSTRRPDPPVGINAECIDTSTAKISWVSKFNGGKDQHFIIAFKKSKDLIFKEGTLVSDPGKEETASGTIDQLDDGTLYFFTVSAKNEFGITNLSMILNCTTQKEQSESLGAVIGGAAGGGLALIIIAVVAVVCYLRRKDKSKGDGMELMNQRHGNEDDSEDGIKPNIIYESAGPDYKASPKADNNQYAEVDRQRNAKPNDVYAEVDKNRKQESVAAVYAEVVKPKGKKQKADKKGKKKIETSNPTGDVYENVDAIGGTVENGDVYENSVKDKDQNNKMSSRKKNKDGLVYIDVVIKDTGKGDKKGVIHGIENRNDYAEVDFTRHADPLPSDDEENDPSEKTTATPDESH